MSPDAPMTKLLRILTAGAALAVLGGCAGNETLKGVAEISGFATTPQESKPFVQASRPEDPAYVPVGRVVTRTAPRKPVAEFKTLEAELEAKRLSNEAAGSQATALGKVLPPPAPPPTPPLN